jgi:hypothetical protein
MKYETPELEVIGSASELIQGKPGPGQDPDPILKLGAGVVSTLLDE